MSGNYTRLEYIGGVCVITVHGICTDKLESGVVTLGSLEVALAHIKKNDARLVLVNLNDVSFMNSTGLGMLVAALVSAMQRGGSFALCNVPQRVMDLLILTKTRFVFTAFATQDIGLRMIGSMPRLRLTPPIP